MTFGFNYKIIPSQLEQVKQESTESDNALVVFPRVETCPNNTVPYRSTLSLLQPIKCINCKKVHWMINHAKTDFEKFSLSKICNINITYDRSEFSNQTL